MKHSPIGAGLLVASGFALAWSMVVHPPAQGQETGQSINVAHVDVQFDRGVPQADAQKVADFLEKQYATLRSRLGFEPAGKIVVHVYESVGRYMAEAGSKKPWRLAIYSKGILYVQPVSALVQRRMFEKALIYEFSRAYLVPAGEKGCPPWLCEAFAVYHSGEMADLTPPIGARISAFSDLAQDLQDYTEPPQREDVHFYLGQTMKFFIDKYGEQKAYGLFKAFDGTTSVEGVFKKLLGSDYASVEKEWAKAIAIQSRPFKEKGR